MIRSSSLLPRRDGVTSAEFHDHWRHPHGTMGRLIPGLGDDVQAHQVHTDVLGADQARYEGVAISSFDSAQAAARLLTEPQYLDHVAPDEAAFQDVAGVRFLSTEEEVLVSRPTDGAHPADARWNVLERPTSTQLLQFVHTDGRADWAGEDDAELSRRIGALRHARNQPSTAAQRTATSRPSAASASCGGRRSPPSTPGCASTPTPSRCSWPAPAAPPPCSPSANASCADGWSRPPTGAVAPRAGLAHPPADPAALAAAASRLDEALAHGTLLRVLDGEAPSTRVGVDDPVHLPAWTAVEDHLQLLGRERARIRRCAGHDGVLHLHDSSGRGDRRWCSTAGCGNRAEAARHRAGTRPATIGT